MIDYNDKQASAKPERGIPAAVRQKLKEAIRAHLKEHGSRRNRHLLREHPELSSWIGADVGSNGETGDKRLDRLVKEVKAELARAKRGVPPVLKPSSTPDAQARTDPLAGVLAGGEPVLGYAELQARLRGRLVLIEEVMEGCVEAGQVNDLLKLSREHRAIVSASATLAGKFNAAMKSAEVQKRLLAAAFESHAGDPKKAQAFAATIDQIFNDFTGLSARGEGQ